MGKLVKSHSLAKRSIRASNVVLPFGVGAMIDMPEGVFMTASCDNWNKKQLTTIHDERLEKVLRVKFFKSPVIKGKDGENTNAYIPMVQFPRWLFCPKCRKFQPLEKWEKKYKELNGQDQIMKQNRCPECRVKLSPSRIITACENGHIDDFPWIQWVHYKNNKSICPNPDIYIKTNGVSSGLEGIIIECKNCNIKANLTGAFGKRNNALEQMEKKAKSLESNEEYSLCCRGYEPWSGKYDKCILYPTVLQRGATNVYFQKIESSILIPPYSEKINIQIEDSEAYKSLLSAISVLKQTSTNYDVKPIIEASIEASIANICDEINKPTEVVEKIINRKLDDGIEKNYIEISKNKYKEEEYKAIIGEFGYDALNQIDFKTEGIEGDKYLSKYIDKVVLIHKMKEIRALVGFSRINSPDTNIIEVDESEGESTVIRPLEDKNWYPAIEVIGEGIFIKFNNDIINMWMNSNPRIITRADNLNCKYNKVLEKRGHVERKNDSKFLLLHTLAHLVMKELSFKCGYSSTSLRERIYCNQSDESYQMSGILIYTANGDSEGTMGGLVRQGREDKLPLIINSAIEKARFCSSDPVCIESMGQGRDALNLSACYSCALIPETSCEEFNTLLDRAMIVGTLDDPTIGFFNFEGAN